MIIQKSDDATAFNKFELQGWENNSTGYDQHFGPITQQSVKPTLDAVILRKGMRVLDVCTGPGMLASSAAVRGADAIGLDFSEEAINIARRNVPGADFQQGDAQSLPFDDNSFDAVVCGFGIIHVPSPEAALKEMIRVLRTGGSMAISVWDVPDPSNGFGIFYEAAKLYGDMTVPLPHGPDFFQFSTDDAMTTALATIGLKDISVTRAEQFFETPDAAGLMQAIAEGTVRASGLLRAQTAEARAAIYAKAAENVEAYNTADGTYRIPMPAVIGSGRK